jgi:hypothetical protein
MKILRYLIPLLMATLPVAKAFDQSHAEFTALIKKYVTDEGVRYAALQENDDAKLDAYLATLENVSMAEFNGWKGEEQLAYLINLYNASTLDLVLKHYPIRSLKEDVGGLRGPWKISFIKALGNEYSLDEVEHELIRKNYKEPRIHFAVNCAAIDCPPIRQEAYTGNKLLTQLEEQTKKFLQDEERNRLTNNALKITPLFDWYEEDFVSAAGSVKAFLNPYFPKVNLEKDPRKIEYTDYDWNLNKA